MIGNSKTNDHVIMREIRTKPGDLFKRSDIMRSQGELNNLQYFDPEKFDVKIEPNQSRNTVDITYVVSEKSTDQINLQGGWGAGRVVGSLGFRFTNFSSKSFLLKKLGDLFHLVMGKLYQSRPLPMVFIIRTII